MLLHKTKLMEALWTINEALDRAKATNVPLTSLMSLLPTFAVFMEEGNQLGVFGHRLGQILACWGLIWLLVSRCPSNAKTSRLTPVIRTRPQTYPPAALSLILTLTKQERHLASSLANFHDVDALASRPPDVYRPTRTSTSSSKKIEIASSADGGSLTPGVAETVPVLVDLPSTAFGRSSASSSAEGAPRDRTAVQKAEAMEKLRAVRRIKLVLLAQFCTTLIMLLVYGSLECQSTSRGPARSAFTDCGSHTGTLFTPWFNSLDSVVMYNVSETWLGWAFLVVCPRFPHPTALRAVADLPHQQPGTFSSAAFVWASYHIRGPVPQPSRPPSHPVQAEPFLPPPAPSSVRSPTSPASTCFPPSHSAPPSSSSGRSLDRWRKFRWSNAAPSLAGTRQGEELSFVKEEEGESRRSGGWVPSVWAREKKEEAILLEVRGGAR